MEAAGVQPPPLTGPVFDSAALAVEAAMAGHGVALAPATMFERALADGRLARPFAVEVDMGGYWLTSLKSRRPTPAMATFETWIADQVALSSDSTVSRSLV
jgi:LysR family transcriptional regulator of beta-lactamase